MLVKANLNGNEVEYDDKEFEVLKENYKGNPHFKYLHYIGKGRKVLNPKGNVSCYNMFYGCRRLSTLDLSNFDTRNVINMRNMFYDCESLTTLDLSNFDTKNVTDMSGMFRWCTSLSILDLSNFDTKNVTDMNNMFRWCKSLTTLDLSSFDTKNVTYMTDMFCWCESLVSVKLNLNNLGSYDTKALKKSLSECNIPPSVINSTPEQVIKISTEAYNFIISSSNISPLLSLVREKDCDFNILNVVKNRVKDKNKTGSFNSR